MNRPPGRRISQRPVAIACLCLLALLALGPISLVAAAPTAATAELPAKDELERQKLNEEVRKLKHGNRIAEGFSGILSRYATLVTAAAAAGGLIFTILKQSSDRRAERERDAAARATESEQRLEDRFAAILSELGETATAKQAGAAASLVSYLRPEHKRFHHQVRIAVLTNLKVDHEEPIRKLLARVYKEALTSGEAADGFERDLSRAKLGNTDLSGLELREADLGFADLSHSTLVGCDLYRARGYKVKLEDARASSDDRVTSLIEVRFHQAECDRADFSGTLMINAHLAGAKLNGVHFHGTRLQAAHLEDALLIGAQFQGADVNDTYFYGAHLDDVAILSLFRAFNWRNAHFDHHVESRLQQLASQT